MRDIVWRLRLAAAPSRVRAAWLDPREHERFWCEQSEAIPGGYRLQFIDGTVTDCAVSGETSPTRFAFSYFGSQVEVSLDARGAGTDLTLTASGVPPEEWCEVSAGWLNVLLPLKAWLDFGIDLRNHDPRRTWRERYVDQ
jgi:hypothetical protein